MAMATATGAARNLDARVLAARQLELRRQPAQIRQARQEAHHVDMVHRAAVALCDLSRSEPRALRDVGQIEAEARIVAGGNAPATAGALGRLEAIQQRREAALQLRLLQLERIVVHQKRAECRHRLDHALGWPRPGADVQGEHEARSGAGRHDRRNSTTRAVVAAR
jgi:hypothetical protein